MTETKTATPDGTLRAAAARVRAGDINSRFRVPGQSEHPIATALLVADWLDATADEVEENAPRSEWPDDTWPDWFAALAVARALLPTEETP